MNRCVRSTVTALAIAAGTVCSFTMLTPAAHAAEDQTKATALDLNAPLPTDGRLTTGTLPNGMNYIVRQHSYPPGRFAVWMHVSTGSLNETDKQRGMAHYLEHMAFNGSKNFAPGTVIELFQSLGLNFGQHQNAFTSFDQTTYQLALPDTSPEKIDKALTFMADVKGRMLLLPKEIEEERGIILEERRTRIGGRQRINDYFLENLAPGSIFGKRLPIGVEETIRGVQEADFKEYYGKFYVPSNMTVMIVADMPAADIVKLVEKYFSEGEKVAKPADQEVGIKPYEANRAVVASDKEITDASVGTQWLYAAEKPATTVALYKRDLTTSIGTWVFNRRMQEKVSQGKVAFLGGGASAQDLFAAGYTAGVQVRSEPEKWEQSLKDMAVELRRANLHGFTEQEVADARKELLAGAERFVETEKTLPATSMLASWNNSISDSEPILSAEQELKLYRDLLPTITAAEVSTRFNTLFNAEKPLSFSLQLPASAKVPTEAEMVSIGQQALAVKPDAEKASDRPTSLIAKAPEPAKITDVKTHDASKVVTGWLENGAAVNYRFMDYKKDQVTISITLATGEMMETEANRGITFASALAWNRPATSTLTSTNIRDIMTGKKVNVGGGPSGPDSVSMSVSGSPQDLEIGLQLAHLMLTDPVIEAPSFAQFKQGAKLAIGQRRKDIQQFALGEILPKLIYPASEARFLPFEEKHVDAMTLDAAQKWLREKIITAPMQISVVGDIDQAKAMDLVQRYLGTLPKRERITNSMMADVRKVNRPKGPLDTKQEFTTTTDKAMVGGGFFGPDSSNVRDVRLMQVAGRILSSRAIQEVREKTQLAYSPSVGFRPSPAIPGYSSIIMASSTDPAKVDAFRAKIFEMFDAFAKDGPTSEEMDTVRKQFANTWDEQMREPGYWSTVLGGLNYRWQTLDDVMAGPEQFQKFTAQEIKDAFNRYYKPEAKFLMSATPAKQ